MSSFSFNTFPYYAFSASTFLLFFYPLFSSAFTSIPSSVYIFLPPPPFFSFHFLSPPSIPCPFLFSPPPPPPIPSPPPSASSSTTAAPLLPATAPLPRSGTKRRLGFPRDAGGRATLRRPRRIRAVILLCHESGDVTYYMIV